MVCLAAHIPVDRLLEGYRLSPHTVISTVVAVARSESQPATVHVIVLRSITASARDNGIPGVAHHGSAFRATSNVLKGGTVWIIGVRDNVLKGGAEWIIGVRVLVDLGHILIFKFGDEFEHIATQSHPG